VNLALGRLGGGSGRQAGSSFKPFVLAKAFEAGIGPDKKYRAPAAVRPRGFDKPVHNYGGASYGTVDLRTATHKSINTVFVQLITDVGVNETAEMAQRLGIKGIDLGQKQYGVLALGTQETSPLEMASAYGVFANRGLSVEPTPVRKITNRAGEVVEDNETPSGRRVLDEAVADHVTGVLEGVLTKGTARRAVIGRPAAGKTGTSQNWENAWFVGYTPTLSTAVWMGHPDTNRAMAGVHGVAHVTGGTLPAMIWHDFMIEATATVAPVPFAVPGVLRSVAEREARQRRALDKRLDERDGIGIPLGQARTGIPANGPWYVPPPVPAAQAPAGPAPVPARPGGPAAPPAEPGKPPPSAPPPARPETTTTTLIKIPVS
jgi:penicillin-binding protein 1A